MSVLMGVGDPSTVKRIKARARRAEGEGTG